jgi:ribosomal protein S18 acetylase RimI-like enzyme
MNLALVQAKDTDAAFIELLNKQNMSPYFQRHGIAWDQDRFDKDWVMLENYIITSDNIRVGTLRLSADDSALHIRDIQISPAFTGQGIGSWAIQQSLLISQNRGYTCVVLRVFKDNPAMRLYERLGFSVAAEDDHIFHMRKLIA